MSRQKTDFTDFTSADVKLREVWLMPANPDYQPIDGRECTILGRVVAVVRQY